MKRKKKVLSEVTFVKLIPLRANTAKALNSTPGPSSRVKTTLVYEEDLQINIQNINQIQRHEKIKAKKKTKQNKTNQRFIPYMAYQSLELLVL